MITVITDTKLGMFLVLLRRGALCQKNRIRLEPHNWNLRYSILIVLSGGRPFSIESDFFFKVDKSHREPILKIWGYVWI